MNKGVVLTLAIILIILGVGGTVFLGKKGDTLGRSTSSNNVSASSKNISLSEVATHSNMKSCWLVIEGGVYDITNFISRHPGGNRILLGCGKDASTLFNGTGGHLHSQAARAILKNYKIGNLAS